MAPASTLRLGFLVYVAVVAGFSLYCLSGGWNRKQNTRRDKNKKVQINIRPFQCRPWRRCLWRLCGRRKRGGAGSEGVGRGRETGYGPTWSTIVADRSKRR
ncbi:hypothetical protein Pyn_08930 [Prunus yedoensis var. nudiflora]|uniref:Uncharacterized protein n=1 Tax=Prunus yedoensis var. nudiflora TaxID=2094558 RepID=A0A314ZA83_PRUYE|nr:hypothetical protein Pyn_08930 [Prunus yedoensis var. nudiflora]